MATKVAAVSTLPSAPRSRVGPIGERLPASAWAWAIYQACRDPSAIILNIYVFVPYFAAVVVKDAVAGQTLVAETATMTGLIVALTAPLLGVALDKIGRRKPPLAVVTALQSVLLASLWFAAPDGSGLSVFQITAVLVAIGVLFQWADVLFTALLPGAAPPALTPRVSGLAQALGNAASVAVLLLVLWLLILPGRVAAPLIPLKPLLGLNAALHEPERFAEPLMAVLLVLGSVPLLVLVRDAMPNGFSVPQALRAAPRDLGRALRGIAEDRDGVAFLVSRMLYTDGLGTLMIFTGVYTAGTLGWRTMDLLCFGLILSSSAVAGGLAAGRLDQAIGPRRAIQLELAPCAVAATAQIGMGRDQIFYIPYARHALWSGPVFQTLPDLLYLGIGMITAAGICAVYASSRTLLVRVAPPERLGAYLGLFALSGQATAWLGPFLVGICTALFASQRIGFAAILTMLLAGLAGLFLVKTGEALPTIPNRTTAPGSG